MATQAEGTDAQKDTLAMLKAQDMKLTYSRTDDDGQQYYKWEDKFTIIVAPSGSHSVFPVEMVKP